jgi:hypothetical protein
LERDLPPPVEASIELALDGLAPAIVDLRSARAELSDAETVARLRMEDYAMDGPILDAFDGVAIVPEIRPATFEDAANHAFAATS